MPEQHWNARRRPAGGRAAAPAGAGPGCSGRTTPRRRTSAGVALAVRASLLAACGGGDEGIPTLTWYTNPDAGGQAILAQRCTEAAGGAYEIQVSVLPQQAAAQREQLVRRLAAKDSSIDLMSLDPPFIPGVRRGRLPRAGAGRPRAGGD